MHASYDRVIRYPHVGVLPFFNLTLPRHDMHEAGYCAFEGLRGRKAGDPPPYCWCAHVAQQLWCLPA